jgi:hypothetical protein
LQALSWSLVVISAFLAGALANISANPGLLADPLSIGVPEELWILMGISFTSLIDSPLILSQKEPATEGCGGGEDPRDAQQAG